MSLLGVNVAVIDGGRILLMQREDFEVWGLPGGGVDTGETLAEAALRETLEETGLEVKLERLVGIYSRLGSAVLGGHVVLFTAKPVGGQIKAERGESVDVRYFAPEELPEALLTFHHRRIQDGLNGVGGGVAWRHDREWPFEVGLTRQGLYEMRDDSGLGRAEFYRKYLGKPGKQGDCDQIAHSRGLLQTVALQEEDPDQQADFGVNCAIIKNGMILLTLREDFQVWCLPGGRTEENETLAGTAIRETKEETGLDVRLTRLVGVYSDPRWFRRGLHVAVFAAEKQGGTLIPQEGEALEARYFSLEELPTDMMFGHRQRALHALEGVGGGVAWHQIGDWLVDPGLDQQAGNLRQQLYASRDQSGLSRRDFYFRHFGRYDPAKEILEVSKDDR